MGLFERAIESLLTLNVNTILVFALVYLLSHYFIILKLKRGSLPPGPYGIPFFGYSLFIKKPIFEVFDDLATKYGNVFSMSFGTSTVVVLNDPKIIKDCFKREEFTGKPQDGLYKLVNQYGKFIILNFYKRQNINFFIQAS